MGASNQKLSNVVDNMVNVGTDAFMQQLSACSNSVVNSVDINQLCNCGTCNQTIDGVKQTSKTYVSTSCKQDSTQTSQIQTKLDQDLTSQLSALKSGLDVLQVSNQEVDNIMKMGTTLKTNIVNKNTQSVSSLVNDMMRLSQISGEGTATCQTSIQDISNISQDSLTKAVTQQMSTSSQNTNVATELKQKISATLEAKNTGVSFSMIILIVLIILGVALFVFKKVTDPKFIAIVVLVVLLVVVYEIYVQKSKNKDSETKTD